MTKKTRRLQAGFTLIELLTVIAIIGILASIIIPTVGNVRKTAQRTVDANSLREIAKTAQVYATDNGDRLPGTNISATLQPDTSSGATIQSWAGVLARSAGLNQPSFYFSKNDSNYPAVLPPSIIDIAPSGAAALNAEFSAATTILAIEVVGGLRLSDPSTCPLAYTRGLKEDGEWDIAAGTYQAEGGHIAFIGGNVVYYKNLTETENQQVKAKASGAASRTSNIKEALPYRTNRVKIYATSPAIIGSITGTDAGVQ